MNTENSIQNNFFIHITYELYPKNLGGIGVIVFNLVNQIAKEKPSWKFEILVPSIQSEFENKFISTNVKIVTITDCFIEQKLDFSLFCKKIQNYIDSKKSLKPIIHFHDISLFHLLSNYKRVIYTFHKDDEITIPQKKKIDACVYFTKHSKQKNIIPAKSYYIIPNGIPFEKKKKNIAYIGRNSVEKGFDKFIYYTAKTTTNENFITAGFDKENSEKIKNLGILDNLEISKLLETIDYLLVPSVKEEFGLIILEALQKNVIVFVEALPQLKELFRKFENVKFIKFDKHNFVKKIDKIINKQIKKEKLFEQFLIEEVAKKYMDVYGKM